MRCTRICNLKAAFQRDCQAAISGSCFLSRCWFHIMVFAPPSETLNAAEDREDAGAAPQGDMARATALEESPAFRPHDPTRRPTAPAPCP